MWRKEGKGKEHLQWGVDLDYGKKRWQTALVWEKTIHPKGHLRPLTFRHATWRELYTWLFN